MKLQLIISDKAQNEIEDALIWYGAIGIDLAVRFYESVYAAIDNVAANPEQFHLSEIENYREASIERFPFLIIYQIVNASGSVIIASVFNTHRNPEKKF